MKTWDIALVPNLATGHVEVHAADCPLVRAMADAGEPVATLFGCERLPGDLPVRECLVLGNGDALQKVKR